MKVATGSLLAASFVAQIILQCCSPTLGEHDSRIGPSGTWTQPKTREVYYGVQKGEISREEADAYLEVNNMLLEVGKEFTKPRNYANFLEKAAGILHTVLENTAALIIEAESSKSAEVRGYSTDLMGDLLRMYHFVALCKVNETLATSGRVEARLVLLKDQHDLEFIQLNQYITAITRASWEGCGGEGDEAGTKSENSKLKSEPGWFAKVLDWIG